jgi:hypothetical protein
MSVGMHISYRTVPGWPLRTTQHQHYSPQCNNPVDNLQNVCALIFSVLERLLFTWNHGMQMCLNFLT